MEVNTKTPLTPPGSPGSDFAAETDGFGLSPHREPVLSDHDDICVGNTVETPAGFVHRGHVSGRRWIVLSLFLAAYVLNQWDRCACCASHLGCRTSAPDENACVAYILPSMIFCLQT